MSDNLKEREAFEAWYEAYCMPGESDWFRRDASEPDEYHHTVTSEAWAGWNARAAVEASRAAVPAGMAITSCIETIEAFILYGDGPKQAWEAMKHLREVAAPQNGSHLVPDYSALESAFIEYVEEYEMTGEDEDGRDASYTPNENEKAMILDAFIGFDFSSWLTAPQPVARPGEQPRLTVRLTAFPESNGKRNWTALLVRVNPWGGLIGNCGGITIDRGEMWNRVAYEAECARFLIGERDTEPHILDYGDDIETPEEWNGETRGGRPARKATQAKPEQAAQPKCTCLTGQLGPHYCEKCSP